jgi:uncharacterized protein (TIGR02271 family)
VHSPATPSEGRDVQRKTSSQSLKLSQDDADAIVIPIVAEEVVVGRETNHERVRLKKSVRTRDELVELDVQRDEVEVERVAIERVVDEPPRVRVEGDTTIIPVIEEVLVVQKRLVLKEEIRVRKRRTTDRRRLRVPVRAEEVAIERIDMNKRKKAKRVP